MRKYARTAQRLLATLILLLGTGLALSAFAYSREMAIDTSRGVDEAGFVRIGTIDQWIQIRGEDRSNPVLLWLNGGPGFSTIADTPTVRSWERLFTVVMWDQRGEGRTFLRSGRERTGPMTIERMTDDGIELAEHLRRRLGKERIIILGHSWGSVLGVGMVKKRPDLFAAFVGSGQVTRQRDMMAISYPRLLGRARSLGNRQALAQLTAIGPPPWHPVERSFPWFIWANQLDPARRERPITASYPWGRFQNWRAQREQRAGTEFSIVTMHPTLMILDVPALGPRFEVPVIIIQGSEDLVTPTVLAKAYFDSISAPHKRFVIMNGAGHLALFREPERFLAVLAEHARPMAMPTNARSAPPRPVAWD